MNETTPSPLGNVITIDDERIKSHLDRVVRGSVEETLNALLDAEADRLCNAQRYERTEARCDTRAGHYERKLQTKAGEVKLRIPKLRTQTFETAIIERYRRRESSVEEALIEMYLAGVSVRRVEDITEALWGTRVSPSTVSDLNKKILRDHRGLAQPADRRRTPCQCRFKFPQMCRSKIPQSGEFSVISRAGGDQGAPFLGGRPRRRGDCAGIGALMAALERTCSGIRSACCRRR